MSRLKSIDRNHPSGEAKELLERVQEECGGTSNLMRALANSPKTLGSYISFDTKLVSGVLEKKLHDQIALVVAEAHRCEYCLSPHIRLARRTGLSPEQTTGGRDLNPSNPRTEAALRFARRIVDSRGQVSDSQFQAVRQRGYNDSEITEIVSRVAVNILANHFNNVNQPAVDFAKAEPSICGPNEPPLHSILSGRNY